MIGSHTQIYGIEDAIAKFKLLRLCYGLRGEKLEDVLVKAAEQIKNTAQVYAPYGRRRTKGTHLRAAIRARKVTRGGTPGAFVAVDYRKAPHAHFTEFGTVKMGAQYWFRRAIDDNTRPVLDMIAVSAKNTLVRTAAGPPLAAIPAVA